MLAPATAKKIKCQACTAKSRRETKGCGTCGGYGFVMVQARCDRCGSPRWEYPGAFTVYDGKTWKSIDGVKVTYHMGGPSECSKCPPKMRIERAA